MKTLLSTSALLLIAAVVVAGCQKTADAPQAKAYDVNGKVVAVDIERRTVTLNHEDIPGLMQAMEMEFKVANPQVLENVAAGDRVHGQLEVRSGDYVITGLNKH
jgi:protein SCO1/2